MHIRLRFVCLFEKQTKTTTITSNHDPTTPHHRTTNLVRQNVAVAARDGEDVGGAQNQLQEDHADGPGVVRLRVPGGERQIGGGE